MNSSKLSYMLFTLSLILISEAPMPASCQRLFEIVCREAGQEAQCLQLLRSDPRIPSATNYLDLSKFILNLAVGKGIQSQNYFIQLAKTNPNSKAIKQCATLFYSGTVASFRSAMRELADPLTANYDAYVARDGPNNCDAAVKEERIYNPTIFNINRMMVLLSEIAESATNHLRS